jgi:hypothetical protein
MLRVASDGELVWGTFGAENQLQFRTNRGERIGLPTGTIRYLQLNQDGPIFSFSDLNSFSWNRDGVFIGQWDKDTIHEFLDGDDDFAECSGNVLAAFKLLDLQLSDCGVTGFEGTTAGKCQVSALMAWGSETAKPNWDSGFKINIGAGQVQLIDSQTGDVAFTVDANSTRPSAVLLPQNERLAVGDDQRIRVFEMDTFREVASVYTPKPVREIWTNPDESCLAVDFFDGTGIVYDILDVADKKAYWRQCAKEVTFANAYLKRLLHSDIPNAKVAESVMADESLSPIQRLAITHIWQDELAIIEDKAAFVFQKVKSPTLAKPRLWNHFVANPYKRKTLLTDWLADHSTIDKDERVSQEVVQLVIENRLDSDWLSISDIRDFVKPILSDVDRKSSDYSEVLEVVEQALNDGMVEQAELLHYAACAKMRLRKFDEAVLTFQKSDTASKEDRNYSQIKFVWQ